MAARTPIPEHLLGSIKGFVRELDSETALNRLAAVMNLQNFIGFSEVREALQRQLEVETDDECRDLLGSVLEKSARGHERPKDKGLPDELDELLRILLQTDPAKIGDLLETWSGRFFDKFETVIDRCLDAEFRPGALSAILRKSREKSTPSAFKRRLERLFSDSQPTVLLRTYPILIEVEPGTALERLPKLLLHRALPVRIMAVRTLYRLYPEESLRMLGEMLQDEREVVRTVGISLMMTFPFQDVFPLLLQALEEGKIQGRVFPLVVELVRNNPDRDFFRRLAELYCRLGGDNLEAKTLLRTVAESMSLVQMEIGTPGAIMGKYIEDARNRLSRLLTTEITTEPDPTLAPEPAPARPVEKTVSEKTPSKEPTPISASKPVPSREKDEEKSGLESLIAAKADFSRIKPLLPAQPTAELIGKLLSIPGSGTMKDQAAISWLVGCLESPDPKVVIPVMEFLALRAPKSLVPQLQLLCFHPDPVVVNQGIRHFRRLDENGFVLKVQSWITDGSDSRPRRAALTGLAQMKFSRARPLVLKALEKLKEPDLIQGFGNLLLMNPESDLSATLQTMAEKESGNRKEYLLRLSDQCAQNYRAMRSLTPDGKGRKGALASFLSGEQFETLLDEVRKIHFNAGAAGVNAWLSDPVHQALAFIVLTVILTGFLISSPMFKGQSKPTPAGRAGSGKTNSSVIPMPNSSQTFKPGEALIGNLILFDTSNLFWVFKCDDKRVFQVMFPANAKVKHNQRLELKLQDSGKQFRGRPIFSVTDLKPLVTNPKSQ